MSVKFHFLNVGSGDCTIIHFSERKTADGRTKSERIMMVDINHHDDHDDYEHVVEYYREHFKNEVGKLKPIFRFVCSHPHQDHICGIKNFFETKGITISNFWDVPHSFEPADFDGHPTHKDDWKHYLHYAGTDSPATVIRVKREDKPFKFWDEDEDRITVLNPCNATIKHARFKEDGTEREPSEVQIDEVSYALSIRINQRSVVLAGDGRASPVWEDIAENCGEELRNCFVLKAAHHGHKSGFHEDAAKLMAPLVIIISNSAEEDAANGAGALYKKAVPNALILKTHERGTVVIEVPFDKTKPITYTCEKPKTNG